MANVAFQGRCAVVTFLTPAITSRRLMAVPTATNASTAAASCHPVALARAAEGDEAK